MIRNSLKLNHGTFDYYVLQIVPNTKLEEIKSKFLQFKTFDEKNKNIVLDFDGIFDFDYLSNFLLDISDAAKNSGITIHSIVQNDAVKASSSIFNIPVISLPKTHKTQHIYNKTMIIDEPVRSGIKVENDGDIIINTFVSDNAEIVATGNIHVYGEARGRLIAGSSGDKQSRIFTLSFNPELIAIGGIYKTLENQLPQNIIHQPVMVALDNKGRLSIMQLSK